MAKLIVSTADCGPYSTSMECSCENIGTDCRTCMADTRCVWKKKSCRPAPSSINEKARNKIMLSE